LPKLLQNPKTYKFFCLVSNFIKAARLRTLPLSVSGIIVGSGIAKSQDSFDVVIFTFAIITTICLQVLSNFANDYGDGIKGTDQHRTGEKRMVASGEITSKQMKNAVFLFSILSVLSAVALIYLAFNDSDLEYALLFFGLGILSITAAIKYTVGKSAYGYSGFGDLFVFLFFGLLSVLGSFFLYTKHLDTFVFLPAFSVGMLSVAVLNLNNMRDRETDKESGKNTIVVKIGSEFAKYYHFYLIIGSLLFALLYSALFYQSSWQFLFLLAYIPLIKHMVFVAKNEVEAALDGELKKVALSTFLFSVLFVLGLVL